LGSEDETGPTVTGSPAEVEFDFKIQETMPIKERQVLVGIPALLAGIGAFSSVDLLNSGSDGSLFVLNP
jgi:hypothetical protein